VQHNSQEVGIACQTKLEVVVLPNAKAELKFLHSFDLIKGAAD